MGRVRMKEGERKRGREGEDSALPPEVSTGFSEQTRHFWPHVIPGSWEDQICLDLAGWDSLAKDYFVGDWGKLKGCKFCVWNEATSFSHPKLFIISF